MKPSIYAVIATLKTIDSAIQGGYHASIMYRMPTVRDYYAKYAFTAMGPMVSNTDVSSCIR